jgi:hypothetical protein
VRAGALLGALVEINGQNFSKFLLQNFQSSFPLYRALDTLVGSPLSTSWADSTSNFQLYDVTEGIATAPVQVGRFELNS